MYQRLFSIYRACRLAGFAAVAVFAQAALATDQAGAAPAARSIWDLPSPAPAVSTDKLISADLPTGALKISIPLRTPPGRRGIEPRLELKYRSDTGNGLLGAGWRLDLGSVSRDVRQGAAFDGEAFRFHGNDVVHDLVRGKDERFHFKIEGAFFRIRRLDPEDPASGWEIIAKDGTRSLYGQTPASRQDDPADPARVHQWRLDRVEDLHGNFLTITYEKHDGQIYPAVIAYTGFKDQPPVAEVHFRTEERADVEVSYAEGFRVRTARRLAGIELFANRIPQGGFNFDYGGPSGYSAATGQSLLREIQIIPAGGASGLAPFRMTYQRIDQDWTARGEWEGPQVEGEGIGDQVQVADFNADGRADLLHVSLADAGTSAAYLSRGDRFEKHEGSAPQINAGPAQNALAGDFNGDGFIDTAWCENDSDGTWKLRLGSSEPEGESSEETRPDGPAFPDTLALDVNGDKRADLAHHKGAGVWEIYLSGSDGRWGPPQAWPDGPAVPSGRTAREHVITGDLNGDGLADLIFYPAGSPADRWNGFLSTGQGWEPIDLQGPAATIPLADSIQSGDFNGDGRTDVVAYDSTRPRGRWRTALSRHGRWQLESRQGPDVRGEIGRHAITGDFDGDGRDEIIIHRGDGKWTPASLAGPAPDRLLSIRTPLGAYSTFTYASTAAAQIPVASPEAGHQIPFPMHVLESVTIHDGYVDLDGGRVTSKTSYDYAGGYYHRQSRDFRGFHRVKVLAPHAPDGTRRVTETWFHQGDELGVDQNNPAAPASSGLMRHKPYRVKVGDTAGRTFTVQTTTYRTPRRDEELPYAFNPPGAVRTVYIDNNPDTRKRTTVEFRYDQYGNVVREVHSGDEAVEGDERQIRQSFLADEDLWLVNLPAERVIEGRRIGDSAKAFVTRYFYDGNDPAADVPQTLSKGNLSAVVVYPEATKPLIVQRMEHDAFGNVIRTYDGRGKVTETAYDATGTFEVQTINALGHTTYRDYYGVAGTAANSGLYGQLACLTDANGFAHEYTYDGLGRTISEALPDGAWTRFIYDYLGEPVAQQIMTETAAGLSTWARIDGLGRARLVRMSGPENSRLAAARDFDARGLLVRESLPFVDGKTPSWRALEIDAANRVTRVTFPNRSTLQTAHDNFTTTTVDQNGHQTRRTFDAYGQVLRVEEFSEPVTEPDTRAATPAASVQYAWDGAGNLVEAVDSAGNRWRWIVDGAGRCVAIELPDRGRWTYQFDNAGNVIQRTDAAGQTTIYAYDDLNRLVEKTYRLPPDRLWILPIGRPSGPVARFTYDDPDRNSIGRLASASDPSGNTTYAYDPVGRTSAIVRRQGGRVVTTQTAYDLAARVRERVYPDGLAIVYEYDGPFLSKVSTADGKTTYLTRSGFTPSGQPERLIFGNGVETTIQYDPATLRPREIVTRGRGGEILQDTTCEFDAAGNPTATSDRSSGVQVFDTSTLHRLMRAQGVNESPRFTHAVAAYANHRSDQSNIISLRPGPWTPHAMNSEARERSWQYDANGNAIHDGQRRIEYDAENRPVMVKLSRRGVITRFSYDAHGNRVSKVVEQVVRDSRGHLRPELPRQTVQRIDYFGHYEYVNGRPRAYIVADGERLAVERRSGRGSGPRSTQYMHRDHLGSITLVTSARGRLVDRYAYLPHGAIMQKGRPRRALVRDRFAGLEFDPTTNFYLTGAQLYDPSRGGLTSPDLMHSTPLAPQAHSQFSDSAALKR